MADTVKKLIGDIQKGQFPKTARLRSILDKLEVNVLNATIQQLDDVIEVIHLSEDPQSIAGAGASSINTVRNSIIEGVGEQTGGDVDLEATTFNRLRPISRLLNSELPKDEKYELGHRDTSVLSLFLRIMKDEYAYSEDSRKSSRQKALINNALKASSTLDKLSNSELSKLRALKGSSDAQLDALIKIAGAKAEFTVEAESLLLNNIKRPGAFGTRITIDLELKSDNQLKGGVAANLKKKLGIALTETTFNKKDISLEKLFNRIDGKNLRSSPSLKERTIDLLLSIVKGKPLSKASKRSKVQISRSIPTSNQKARVLKAIVRRRTARLQALLVARKAHKGFIIPTVTLKAILNESLQLFIRNKMKPSNSPVSLSYLRNQTGNFSKSAKIVSLTRTEAGMFVGTYDYDTHRYGTFSPTGNNFTVGRNPELYIEGAAREIAIQVLKKNFKGLSLEAR